MSNTIDILKDLQASYASEALGRDAVEEITVDPYRNSNIGECLHELDLVESHEFAMESLGETIRGTVCFNHDLIVANGEELSENFSIESIIEEKEAQYREFLKGEDSIEMSYAIESLVNKAKRAGYNLKINAKELVQKLLTWIKGIFDQYMVADGKFKSYKKLIKKYREKLNVSTPSTKEDKEISIRQTKYKARLEAYYKAIPQSSEISTSSIKGAADVNALVTALVAELTKIMFNNNVPNQIKDGIVITDKSAEDIQEIVKEKKLVDNIKEYLEDLKDEADPEDMSPSAALSHLSSQASQVESLITDRKYKKTIDNLVKAANDTLKKLNKKKDVSVTQDTVEASQKVAALGALVTQYRTHVLGGWTKAMTSMLQALLADMAKVINANTQIKKD